MMLTHPKTLTLRVAAWAAPGLGALALLVTAGCAHRPRAISVDELPVRQEKEAVYRVVPGDGLDVFVWNQERLSGRFKVRGDGVLTLPLAGDLRVAGLTPEEVAHGIAVSLEGYVRDPKVTVLVAEPHLPRISVLGEVRQPGQFEVGRGESVLDMLARAGGLTEFADPDSIYVVRGDTLIRFSYEQMISGRSSGTAFRLRERDVIVVR